MSKYIPFKYRKLTKAVNDFIRGLNPDQHYMNCYRVNAIWFYDNHNWLDVYYDSSQYCWTIHHIFGVDEFGKCKNFSQFKKVILNKLGV